MISDPEYEAKIDDLQKWFEANANLPHEIDRILLKRFYQCMNGAIDETKKLIEINYALRNKHAHIFLNRDPADEDSRRTFEYADMVPLPGLTPENYKVSCYRLCDSDPSKMHHTEDTKAYFMISDCRLCMTDSAETLSAGEVQIFDMAGYTMKHVTKLTINTLRIYIKFLQEAFPVRLKAIHMINCPSYLDRIVGVVKPFISSEVFKLIIFHTQGIESLYEHVPQEMLPEEYGGKAGKMSDLKAQIMSTLHQKRDYLIDTNQWKIEAAESSSSRWLFF